MKSCVAHQEELWKEYTKPRWVRQRMTFVLWKTTCIRELS